MEVTKWLKEQEDIKLVSVKGLTPGAAFNKACEQTEKQEDLLALGKGSVLLPTAGFDKNYLTQEVSQKDFSFQFLKLKKITLHISIVSNLLNGYWTYEDSGILDKTHLRFFTKKEIVRMFSQTGYQIEDIGVTRIYITPEQQKLIEQLCSISSSGMDAFTTYQYLIRARKK